MLGALRQKVARRSRRIKCNRTILHGMRAESRGLQISSGEAIGYTKLSGRINEFVSRLANHSQEDWKHLVWCLMQINIDVEVIS